MKSGSIRRFVRRVMLFTRIDRYIARLILVPLLATLALASMLLVLDKMLRLFDFVVSEGGPVGVVWRMLANLVPEYLALGIPLGLLLGTLLAFRKLALSTELDSLKAVGLSYTRLLRVPYVFAVALMALNVAIVGFVQPVARYGYQQLRFDLRSGALGASIKVGEFTNLGKRMTLRVEASEDKGRLLHGVFVRAETRDGRTIAVTADHGTFLATDDPDVILLRLSNGRLVHNSPSYRAPRVLSFRIQDLPVDLPGGGALPQPRPRRGAGDDHPRAVPPRRREKAVPKATRNAMRANFHYRVIEIVMMLLMPLLAVALAVPPKRSSSGLGIFLAIIMVVAYHKVNQYAEEMAALGRMDPVIALWTPFALFAALILWMYWILAYKPGGQPIGGARARLLEARQGLRPAASAGRRRPGGGGAGGMINFDFFPSKRIAFYMARMFVIRSLAVLAMLVLVLMTLDLLGEAGDILEVPGNGDAELWRYVSLRIPQLISRFLPFAVLLGTLIALATLNQNSEVISMKAAGISAHQIIAPLIVASLGIAALSFAFNERVVTRATETLCSWEKVDYGPVPRDSGIRPNVWVRWGDDLIMAREVRGQGEATELRGVGIYDRHNETLKSIMTARRATRSGGGWRLEQVETFDVASGATHPRPGARLRQGARSQPVHPRPCPGRRAGFRHPQGFGQATQARRPADRRARIRPVAQIVGPAVGGADAAPRRSRRLRPRPLGPAVLARDHRHVPRLRLFRRRQFRPRHGQSRRLPALARRLGAVRLVRADRRDGADPDGGIGDAGEARASQFQPLPAHEVCEVDLSASSQSTSKWLEEAHSISPLKRLARRCAAREKMRCSMAQALISSSCHWARTSRQ